MYETMHVKDEHEGHTKGRNRGRLTLGRGKRGASFDLYSVISLKSFN